MYYTDAEFWGHLPCSQSGLPCDPWARLPEWCKHCITPNGRISEHLHIDVLLRCGGIGLFILILSVYFKYLYQKHSLHIGSCNSVQQNGFSITLIFCIYTPSHICINELFIILMPEIQSMCMCVCPCVCVCRCAYLCVCLRQCYCALGGYMYWCVCRWKGKGPYFVVWLFLIGLNTIHQWGQCTLAAPEITSRKVLWQSNVYKYSSLYDVAVQTMWPLKKIIIEQLLKNSVSWMHNGNSQAQLSNIVCVVVYFKYLIQMNVYQYCLLFKRKPQDNMSVNVYRWFSMLELKKYNVHLRAMLPDEKHNQD